MTITDFELPPALEATAPREPRDAVRLLVSRTASGAISHHRFGALPALLRPGDLLVVNNSGTLPAAIRLGDGLAVHFSTPLPDGAWLVEFRDHNAGSTPPAHLRLPRGAVLTRLDSFSARLWRARLSVAVLPYLLR